MVSWRRQSSFEVNPGSSLDLMDRLRLNRLELLLCSKGDTASYASLHFDHPDHDLDGWGAPGWEGEETGNYPPKPKGCCQKGWGSVILGVLIIINAFLLGVVYFSIRTLTTSLEHVDTVPTYANALLLCCCGVLLVFIYKRHEPIVLLPTLVLCIVCLVLCLASTILTVYRVILTMLSFNQCSFNAELRQCHCYLTSQQRFSKEEHVGKDIVYENTTSCRSIQHNLFQFVCVQGALYCCALVLCACGLALVAHVLSKENPPEETTLQRSPEVDVRSLSSSLHDNIIYTSNFDLRPHSRVARQVALPGVGDTRVFSHSILRLGYGNESSYRDERDGQHVMSSDSSHANAMRLSCRFGSRPRLSTREMMLRDEERDIQETSMGNFIEQTVENTTANRQSGESDADREQRTAENSPQSQASNRQSLAQPVNTNASQTAVPAATEGQNSDSAFPTQNTTGTANARIVSNMGQSNTIGSHANDLRQQLRNQRRQRRRQRCMAPTGTSHSTTCHCPACARSRPPFYMFQPLPNEPPPPYRPHTLPPYVANDPAPEYRSRAATPETLCVRL